MQIELFEREEGAAWRQLPEEVRDRLIEMLARSVGRCVGHPAEESEGDDDR